MVFQKREDECICFVYWGKENTQKRIIYTQGPSEQTGGA